jgi:DNA-binding Lrp family transcriptional regulator
VPKATTQERLATKTPEASFLHVLQDEFDFSLRVSREVMNTAKEMLIGSTPASAVRPGQTRLVVASLNAPFGPPLSDAEKVEVTLTVDNGDEDAKVKEREGTEGLRRGQILRLTEEALEQGGVLTQEDLARALRVDRRTIARAVKALKEEGHLVQTRGAVKGVGRCQTHKVRIIELWLDRRGYDKIAQWVHHSPQSIKRYISTFLRIVILHREETAVSEIAFLTRSSERLVKDYLEVYEATQSKTQRLEKLEEELARVSAWQKGKSVSPEVSPRVGREPGGGGEKTQGAQR